MYMFTAKMLITWLFDTQLKHFNKGTGILTLPKSCRYTYIAKINNAYAVYEALKSPTPEYLPPHSN